MRTLDIRTLLRKTSAVILKPLTWVYTSKCSFHFMHIACTNMHNFASRSAEPWRQPYNVKKINLIRAYFTLFWQLCNLLLYSKRSTALRTVHRFIVIKMSSVSFFFFKKTYHSSLWRQMTFYMWVCKFIFYTLFRYVFFSNILCILTDNL